MLQVLRIALGLGLAILAAVGIGAALGLPLVPRPEVFEPPIFSVARAALPYVPFLGALGLCAVAVAEHWRLPQLIYWLLAGCVVAMLSYHALQASGVAPAALLAQPAPFKFVIMGAFGGFVHWLVAGRRAGSLAALLDDGRDLAETRAEQERRRCAICTVVWLLVGLLPLGLLGWHLLHNAAPSLALRVTAAAEADGAKLLAATGLPGLVLKVDGYTGHVTGTVADAAAKVSTFAKAKDVLAPLTGVPGVIAALQNDIIAQDETDPRVAEENTRIRAASEADARKKAEEERLAAEAEAKRKAADEDARKKAEEERLAAEAEVKRKAADEEARKKAEEERLAAQAEAKRKAADEEARKKAEEERLAAQAEKDLAEIAAKRKALEEEQLKAEADRLAQIEAERKQQEAAAQAKAAAEAELKRKAAEEESRRKAEEARLAAEAELKRKAADEESRKQAEEARVAAEAESKRKAADEEARQRVEAERLVAEIAAKRKAVEEAQMKAETQRLAQIEAERKQKEADEQAKAAAAADAKRRADEAEARQRAEAERQVAEIAAKRKAAEDAQIKAETERLAQIEAERKQQEAAAKAKAAAEAEAKRKADEAASPKDPAALKSCEAQLEEITKRRKIFFKSASSELRKIHAKILDAVAALSKRCIEMTIIVSGHTDFQGDEQANQQLSEERAEAVRAALVERGVDSKQLEVRGYAWRQSSDGSMLRGARASDRRAEFTAAPRSASQNPVP